MNQKQWIQVDESAVLNERRISRSGLVTGVVPAVVLLVVATVLGQPIVGLVVGVAAYFGTRRLLASSADRILSAGVEMRELGDDEHSRLFNVVEGLCVVSGDQRPTLYLVDSGYPVAAAIVDSGGDNAIVVSDTFMSMMDRVEVEGVMAHLLWRLRTGNVALVAHLLALTAILRRVGLSSVARRVTQAYLSPDVLMWADIFACQATRFPPALASALEKSQSCREPVDLGAADSLCFALPTDSEGDAGAHDVAPTVVGARPSLSARIAIVKEL